MKVKGQESRVESQKRAFALRLNSGPRGSRPSAFTLVELLVVITIIGILAALVLGVASIAGENAREQHTRHVIARLHTLLNDQYDTYKNRRIKVKQTVLDQIAGQPWTEAEKGRARAEARMYALRELMLMEMPDRWSDVTLRRTETDPIGNPFFLDAPPSSVQGFGINGNVYRTPVANAYLRRRLQLPNTVDDENQSAECLYMLITLACGDGEARSVMGENTIGDTDGDGAPEFLDGWKRPIRFIRWAPGFDSQIQANANMLDNPESGTSAQAWAAAASSDHDPFDMFRVQPNAYRLTPLIFSLGRDEESGIFGAPDSSWPLPNMAFRFSRTAPQIQSPVLSPYLKGATGYPDDYPGTKLSAEATDNIHNHLMGQR